MSRGAALDRFRLAAAVLVIAIHTSPLASWSEPADFLLTRVMARVAVPFFLMASGYFLAREHWNGLGRFWKRTALLYAAAVALYLPLNLYNGGYGPLEWGKKLLLDGTFYHLWYFPAVLLGVLIARALWKLGPPGALALAGALYLIGLGGDSYYGLLSPFPALNFFYDGLFTLFDYTRSGLFYAPLFLLLGASGFRWSKRVSTAGFALSLGAMIAEGLWLHGLGVQRHDSMYLALPLCMAFLFSLLLGLNRGRDRSARSLSLLIYLLHPWCIVLVRGGAKLLRLEGLLIDNSALHFLAVLALSFLLALAALALRPTRPDPTARAWKELDRAALVHNANVLRQLLPRACRLMAVVKADAYGHGSRAAAVCLQRAGVDAFAVATLEEGVSLRKSGIRGTILVLGWTDPAQAARLVRWRLTQTVADEAHGLALAAQGKRLRVHLALDTGMGRLGVPAEDTGAIARLYRQKNLDVRGVFSHLSMADSLEPDAAACTRTQMRRFYRAVEQIRAAGLDQGALHLQASGGVLNLPPQPCTFARVGIALYGVSSDGAPSARTPDLRPALSLRARVACVRTLRPGERAGYGGAFTAERETRLAVLAIGYADGLPRELARRGGRVLLHGRFAPMVGRMCMDQLLVDVTELPEAAPGDAATLIGSDGGHAIRAEELAQKCGTITNELLSRLGPRLGCVEA